MNKTVKSIGELVGNTPLMELVNYNKKNNTKGKILAKLEYFNPAGSIKDRVGYNLIKTAEEKGLLKPGATIIEPTSGNTGIGLAAFAAVRGYKTILTMPETMSIERQKLLAAYGAEIVLTQGSLGMKGAIDKAEKLHAKIPNSFIPAQFDNQANPEIHIKTTGPEIWEATEGKVDILVATVGTGGTITGTGTYLKLQNPAVKVVAVEPSDSPLLQKGVAGSHKIQGIGANFVPKVLDTKIYDEIIGIEYNAAIKAAQTVAKTDGILVGISSGAALHAATLLAEKQENAGKNIVVILPDTGERYLSTELFAE